MRILAGIDADAELLVRGEAPPGADPELVELAAFARELRAAYARPPAEDVGDRQLAAIVAEAATVSAGSAVAVSRDQARAATRTPPARRGRTVAFRLAAAGLATLLAVTGLAIAGVKAPGPLEDVLERIGIGGSDEAAQPAGGGDASGNGGTRGDGAAQTRGGGTARSGGQERGADQARRGAEVQSHSEPGARGQGDQRRSEAGTINSAPGQATAEQAWTGERPPQSPGRSGDHAPEGTGRPTSPGSQDIGTERGTSQSEGERGPGQRIAEEALDQPGLPQ